MDIFDGMTTLEKVKFISGSVMATGFLSVLLFIVMASGGD